jgi:hypothetical protein
MTRQEFGSYEWAEAHHYETARKSAMVLWQIMQERNISYRFRRDYFSIEQMGEMLHEGMEVGDDWPKVKSIHLARLADLWFDIEEPQQGKRVIVHRVKHLWEKFGKE